MMATVEARVSVAGVESVGFVKSVEQVTPSSR